MRQFKPCLFDRGSVTRARHALGVLVCVVSVWGAHAAASEPIDPALSSSRTAAMDLETGWGNPPRIARTRCWWWWLNGNVSRESISRDLAAMKAQGFGGANVIDAGGADQRGNRQVPHGPDFGSPAWRTLFVHALAEADKHDLELGFNILSGWNLGGPSVTPEQAAKKLTWSETVVTGAKRISLPLKVPPHREGFYRDVATVAFPIRETGPDAPTITGSSHQPDHGPALALDGRAETFWVSNSTEPGGGPSENRPQWLDIECREPVRVSRIVLTPRSEYGPKSGSVELVADGSRRRLATFTMKPDAPGNITIDPPVTTAHLRMVFTAAYDPRFPDQPRNVQVAEVMLFDGDRPLCAAAGTKTGILHFEQKAYYKYPGQFTATKAWHLLETRLENPADVSCRSSDVIDVSSHVRPDGQLVWDAPAGHWRVLRFGYTLTGSHVSTHSEGAGGLAIDYLDRSAFESYWHDVMDPILAEAKPYLGRSLRFLHTDSWELGPVNWTPAMPDQYRRLRGYALTPYLPVLANYVVDGRGVSTRVLNDFRRTLADLIAENKYVAFSDHAHAVGLGIHPESGGPHAAPIDALANLGISDVPMGEFWARSKTHRVQDSQRYFVKQTTSAAHVYGRRLSLAEAFTTIGPQWERDPAMLKPCFDRAACEGHNLTMWHTFDCSPREMGIPGQVYFAGTHLNPQVTWWGQSHAFIAYMNRCHFLLQQGLPVSDALYYYGENIPSFVRLKRDDPAGVLPGYDYDVIDTTALLTRTRVDASGRIVLPDGTSYAVLALPPYDAISLSTLGHIAALVEQGATLVGVKPARQYGLTGYPQSDQAFADLTSGLWGACNGKSASPNFRGKGRVYWGPSTRQVLEIQGIGPDFTWEGGDDETLIDYIHRATDTDDIYFVVNRNDRPETIRASFRTTGRQAELWDPVTGQRREAAAFTQTGGRTILPLELGRESSLFVLFREPIPVDARGSSDRNVEHYQPVQTLSGAWTVRFDPDWGGPAAVTFDELVDWTMRPEEGIRYYSGKATYAKTFELKLAADLARTVVLDLGELKNLAEVTVNGKELGVVWNRPFRIDITDAVRPGRNQLEITVVNLWPNRLIGDQRLPPEQRRTRTNITKFKKDTPLLPSGLLGPVRILGVADSH